MKYKKRYPILACIAIAVLLLYTTRDNFYASMGLLVTAYYIYDAEQMAQVIIDRKERWVVAQHTQGGRNIMPDWKDIQKKLNYEEFGSNSELALYGYISKEDARRHAYVIDNKGHIRSQYNPNINKLDYGTWRRLTMDDANGVGETIKLDKAVEIVEKHGYRVVLKRDLRPAQRER